MWGRNKGQKRENKIDVLLDVFYSFYSRLPKMFFEITKLLATLKHLLPNCRGSPSEIVNLQEKTINQC